MGLGSWLNLMAICARDQQSISGMHWSNAFRIFAAFAIWGSALAFAGTEIDEQEYPEAQEIERILAADKAPAGVLFNVLEYDEDALEWLAPRIEHYISLLRKGYPELSIVIVSHGDEIFALREQEIWLYREVHQRIQRLVEELDVTFHVCGAYARANGIDESEFPQYIDVVPLATTQIKDYRELDFKVVTIELSW